MKLAAVIQRYGAEVAGGAGALALLAFRLWREARLSQDQA